MDSDNRCMAVPPPTGPDRADEAVIEPRKAKREETLPGTALMVFTPQDLDTLSKLFDEPPRFTHRLFLTDVRVGTRNGKPIAVSGPMLGAPQAVLAFEKMIALGVGRVLALGWCGSIHPTVRIGDVVLPTGALAEEGTSRHYPVNTRCPRPSREALVQLERALATDSLTVHEGCVWSIDAPYRETRGKVLAYQKEGLLAVDMESSALLTVAHYRSVELALALVASDELFSLEWVHGFRDSRFQRAREILAEKVLDAAASWDSEQGMIDG